MQKAWPILSSWKTPEQAPRRNIRRVEGITQLPLFEPDLLAQAVDANEESVKPYRRIHLHLMGEPPSDQDAE